MTIVVAGALLLVLSMIWHRQPISRTSVMFGVLVLTSALVTQTPFLPRRGLAAERQSAYQLVQVVEQRGTRYLLHDTGRGTQSVYTPGSSITNGPYDIFGYVPFMVQSEQRTRNVLLIGLGGANMPRLYEQLLGDTFQFSITAVEIDPVVVSMAKKYFALDELDVNVVVDDARHFLRTTDKKYDIIIVDAYTHETQIPPMLATQEFFQQTKERLTPGVVVDIDVDVPELEIRQVNISGGTSLTSEEVRAAVWGAQQQDYGPTSMGNWLLNKVLTLGKYLGVQ
jgi:predicted membrane-bound spermidine synthase